MAMNYPCCVTVGDLAHDITNVYLYLKVVCLVTEIIYFHSILKCMVSVQSQVSHSAGC